MGRLCKLALFMLIPYVFGFQNLYKIVLEDLQIDYVNKHFMDIQAGIYNLNKTTRAANSTITLKIDLPPDSKISLKAYKAVNNNFGKAIFQFERRLKDALEMEAFDVQDMCLKYTRPPVVWPLEKNVPYHMIGWAPDSSKYLPSVPEGKWKIVETFTLPNKTKMASANWFINIVYEMPKLL